MSILKINDLSNSSLRKRFSESEFSAENNLTIAVIRKSSKKQERGSTDEDQQETITRYCQRENLKVIRTHKFTETASNFDEAKQFREIMDEVLRSQSTSRPIKNITFSFQSRSNRNPYSARLLEDLVELGVVLHFAREGRKLTCKADIAERLIWHVENLRNEAYSRELSKNAMGGTIKRIETGVFPGKPKFGYKAVGVGHQRHFVFDADNAVYMKRAFQKVIENEARIAKREYSDELLKVELDLEFRHLKKTPNKRRFCELLRSPFYYGDFSYSGTVYKGNPEFHPPLISKSDWLHVQDILEGRRRKRQLSKAHPYIGMMNCNGKILDASGQPTDEICGCSITAERITKSYKNGLSQIFNYYRCSRPKGDKRCSQRDEHHMKEVIGRERVSYTQEEVEIIFQDMFKSFSFDEVTCQRMKEYLWKEHFKEKEKDHAGREQLQRRHDEVMVFIERAYEDKLAGIISEDLWKQQNHKWHAEQKRISAELLGLAEMKDGYMQRGVELIELMQHSEMIYKNATIEKKRRLVEIVASNLLLAEGTLQYHWRVPYNMLAIKGDLVKWLGDWLRRKALISLSLACSW